MECGSRLEYGVALVFMEGWLEYNPDRFSVPKYEVSEPVFEVLECVVEW